MTATKTQDQSLALYRGLTDVTKESLKDEYGMTETLFDKDGEPVLNISGGSEGWCESCSCWDCGEDGCGCGYMDTVTVVVNLRVLSEPDKDGEQEVDWDEGDQLCERCGEVMYYATFREARDAAREAYEEMQFEAARGN